MEEQDKAKQEDLQKRVKSFNADLIELLAKYNLALGAIPFVTKDGRIAANPHVFDGDQVKAGQEKKDAPIAA